MLAFLPLLVDVRFLFSRTQTHTHLAETHHRDTHTHHHQTNITTTPQTHTHTQSDRHRHTNSTRKQGYVSMNFGFSKKWRGVRAGECDSARALYLIQAKLISNGSCRSRRALETTQHRCRQPDSGDCKRTYGGVRVDESSTVFNHAQVPYIGTGVRRP